MEGVMETVLLGSVVVVWLTALPWLVQVVQASHSLSKNKQPAQLPPASVKVVLQWLFVAPLYLGSVTVIAIAQSLCRLMLFMPLHLRLFYSQFFGFYTWSLTVFVCEFWSNTEYRLCTEASKEDPSMDARTMIRLLFSQLNGRNIMSIMNHAASNLDWVAPTAMGQRFGVSGRGFGVMKPIVLMFPAIGWSLFLSGGIILYQSAAVDFPRLAKSLPRIVKQYPQPWTFTFYPEGTRLTADKLRESQQFAQKRGLTVLEHIMQPRTKGFCFFLSQLRGTLDLITDLSIVYHPSPPSMSDLFTKGQMNAVTDIYLRVYQVSEIPSDKEELSSWLYDRWAEKDRIIDSLKKGELKMRPLLHSPFMSALTFTIFSFLSALMFRWVFSMDERICLLWFLTSLLPLWIVDLQCQRRKIEYRQQRDT